MIDGLTKILENCIFINRSTGSIYYLKTVVLYSCITRICFKKMFA